MAGAGPGFWAIQLMTPMAMAVTPFMASGVLYVTCELAARFLSVNPTPDE